MIIDCPSCHRQLRVPGDLLGKMVKCPTCGTAFGAPAASAEPAAASSIEEPGSPPSEPFQETKSVPPSEQRPVLRTDKDDDVPHDYGGAQPPSRRREAREMLPPHRGVVILVLGILSLVSCCFGLILGPIAWIMGNNDLQEIRAGRMDREGEGMTNAGRICGIIGTVLGVLVLCCGGGGIFILRLGPRGFRRF